MNIQLAAVHVSSVRVALRCRCASLTPVAILSSVQPSFVYAELAGALEAPFDVMVRRVSLLIPDHSGRGTPEEG